MNNAIKPLPSAEYLHACFDYDPETGALMWKVRPQGHFVSLGDWKRWNNTFAGTTAGRTHYQGYITVKVNARHCQAHRVIWKMLTGDDPRLEIDHRDGDPANNRFVNLRLATDDEQQWNKWPRKRNQAGRRGVSLNGNKWQAEIRVKGVRHYLGRFSSVEEASVTYEAAASELFGEFYRDQPPKI